MTTLAAVDVECVVCGRPVRRVRSYAGQRHYSGLYWASTTGSHVGYEGRLELDRLMLADFDPEVEWMATQPTHDSSVRLLAVRSSPRYGSHPEPAPSTTPSAPRESNITTRWDDWPAGSSASCTAASRPVPVTTRPPRGAIGKHPSISSGRLTFKLLGCLG